MNKLMKVSVMGALSLGLFGAANSASALAIRNTNEYSHEAVSVSGWGNNNSYQIYDIGPTKWETWDRTDSRGVLVVTHNNNQTYYVDSKLSGYLQGDGVFRSRMGKSLTPIDTDQPSGTSGKITVKNNSKNSTTVSISKWDDSNDGDEFNVPSGSSETWSRDDYRGYILDIQGCTYYTKSGVTIELNSRQQPTVNGKILNSITKEDE